MLLWYKNCSVLLLVIVIYYILVALFFLSLHFCSQVMSSSFWINGKITWFSISTSVLNWILFVWKVHFYNLLTSDILWPLNACCEYGELLILYFDDYFNICKWCTPLKYFRKNNCEYYISMIISMYVNDVLLWSTLGRTAANIIFRWLFQYL